jgi:transcriptional regulator with XRE-family HTH domain
MQLVHQGLLSVPLSVKQCRDLRWRRNLLGLTQNELARRVGCSSRTILRLENAQWAVSPEMLSTICNVLGLSWNINIKVTLGPAKKTPRKGTPRVTAGKRKRSRV